VILLLLSLLLFFNPCAILIKIEDVKTYPCALFSIVGFNNIAFAQIAHFFISCISVLFVDGD
jgi:hypothetical protein